MSNFLIMLLICLSLLQILKQTSMHINKIHAVVVQIKCFSVIAKIASSNYEVLY